MAFKAFKPPHQGEIVLDGERVRLKTPSEGDWPSWTAARAANEAMLRPLEPLWPEDALSETFFARRVAWQRREAQDGRGCSFLIWKDGEVIGGFNLNHILRGATQSAWLGYWLGQEWQGRGLMTEAARLAAGYAFGKLSLHRLNAATLPENERSQALLNRLNFAQEGLARGYIQIHGAWRDHVLFGLTAEDYADASQ
jgi:ribosomal-protein-alanine N-acetyltransferase